MSVLRRGLGWVGKPVGQKPYLFSLLSLCLFILSVVGLYYVPRRLQLDFDRGYTTPDAPSIRELHAQVDFFGNLGEPWYMGLFAEPRDENGNMIGSNEFDEFKHFYKSIKKDIVIKEVGNNSYSYLDYCSPMCEFNDVLFKTYSMSFFGMDWPVTSIFGYESNIGKYFFKRKMSGTNLDESHLQALYFMVFVNSTEVAAEMAFFEREVARKIAAHNANSSAYTTLTLHSAVGMKGEIEKGMRTVVTYIGIGFILLGVVVCISLFLSAKMYPEYRARIVLLSIPALMLPVMSMTTAALFHAFLGNYFNSLMILVPVYAFAAALDGVFFLVNHWLNALRQRIYDSNDTQLQEVFAEAIPSIGVTCLSVVVLLFAKLLPLEQYAHMCFFLGLVTVFTFFYKVFFFAPVMAIVAPVRRHSSLKPRSTGTCTAFSEALQKPYAIILSRSLLVKIVIFVLALGMFAPALIGIQQSKGNLDYRHLLLPESPSNKGVHIMSDIVWPDFLHIIFFFDRPPRFDSSSEYTQFMELVKDIQSLPGTMNEKDNMMWLNDFKRFAGTPKDATSLDMSKFIKFITDDIYQAWNSGVQYRAYNTSAGEQKVEITKMIYMVAFNGTRTMADKAQVMENCRKVAASYPQFEVIPFDTESGMVDVILQAPFITFIVPTVVFLFLCVVYFLFVMNLTTALIVSLAAAFLYFGSYGWSVLLGLYINPFSAFTLVIFSALAAKAVVHLAYFFQLSSTMKKENPTDRLIDALNNGLLPTVQSAVSTSCILLPLLFVSVTLFYHIALYNLVFFLCTLFVSCILLPTILSSLPNSLTGTGCVYTSEH